MTKYIVASSNATAGLANRIKCVISCMGLSEKLGKELILHWPKSTMFNCVVEDLFENAILQTNQQNSIISLRKSNMIHEQINTWRLLTPSDGSKNQGMFRQFTNQRTDFNYNLIPVDTQNYFLKYFNQLIPIGYVREQVCNYSEKFDKETIFFGIRSWMDCEPRRRIFNIENVFKIMDKLPDSNFFVSCDHQEVLDQLLRRYKDRILYFPKRTHPGDRGTTEGIQDALVDLLLLSKARQLRASYHSTFSEVAWWFGRCKAQVEVIEDEKNIKRFGRGF